MTLRKKSNKISKKRMSKKISKKRISKKLKGSGKKSFEKDLKNLRQKQKEDSNIKKEENKKKPFGLFDSLNLGTSLSGFLNPKDLQSVNLVSKKGRNIEEVKETHRNLEKLKYSKNYIPYDEILYEYEDYKEDRNGEYIIEIKDQIRLNVYIKKERNSNDIKILIGKKIYPQSQKSKLIRLPIYSILGYWEDNS